MAPSCIDMGWNWRVTSLGKYGTGYGREWFVPDGSTEKFIVMTAWLAIDLILRHEAMEALHYGNARILDPHKSLDELAYPNKLGQKTETKLQSSAIE